MRTYTEHKLTNHQLKRLHPIVHNKKHYHGMALTALENKGLITREKTDDDPHWTHKHTATPEGTEALKQARLEGW
jgi:DNA-binding MarR family transcriptional regulator